MSDTKTIQMKIKAAAAEKINSVAKTGQVIILALNDGSNKYSDLGGSCTIGANFQFVVLSQRDPDFAVKVANNAGLNLYTSAAELQFLEDNLVVDEKNTVLTLADDSGIIDNAVTIKH
ncbi:iron-sulfur cluster biosynthesis family protein [Lactobacillus xylocopicola]|uniref:Core domain-containing protein n=1 Tax=Lactobacillus xylocopicola TaxID=2976676 RepID=A0ABM8BF28_9LACO|nr:iron-sulfur cluster biosynthesis family protein [Lactobacillus xylocopicola]BDR59848.1 hypothetical protein KIM322_01090 [Lactobacillus xylocopicola]